jgi:site-specific DNA-cytosine methylase
VSRPLAIDLYSGLSGWGEGLSDVGFDVLGFDIENMHAQFDIPRPPGCLLAIQDVLTLHGSQLRDAALIVASPPCTRFSYLAMPFGKPREQKKTIQADTSGSALSDACFWLRAEASAAAGRHIPLVIENVRGAQTWVGPAREHYGSYYLWGDVPRCHRPVQTGSRARAIGSTPIPHPSCGGTGARVRRWWQKSP